MNHDIINWIEINIENGITVDLVANYAGCCRKSLQLMFKKQYGISPGEYIRKRKLTRAAILLRMTRTGVTEIADILKYSSHQNFIRAFRDCFGITPGQYRLQKDTNFSGMQFSPVMEWICIQTARVVYRDAVFIKGYRMSHSELVGAVVFGLDKDIFLNELRKVKSCCDSQVFQVSSFSFPLERVGNYIDLRTVTGCVCQGMFSVESHCIPAGYYASFRFHGTWTNFRLFCQKIYTLNFSELGWQLQWGYHVSLFGAGEGIDEKAVSAECLIPVDIII